MASPDTLSGGSVHAGLPLRRWRADQGNSAPANKNTESSMWWRQTHFLYLLLLPATSHSFLWFILPPFSSQSPPWGKHLTCSEMFLMWKIQMGFKCRGKNVGFKGSLGITQGGSNLWNYNPTAHRRFILTYFFPCVSSTSLKRCNNMVDIEQATN